MCATVPARSLLSFAFPVLAPFSAMPSLALLLILFRMPLDPQRTAAPHEEEEQSPGCEAMSMDNLKAMQQRLARETELKEQALAEMQVSSFVRLPAGGRAAPSSSVHACDRS
jgi:hypothetical protein